MYAIAFDLDQDTLPFLCSVLPKTPNTDFATD